MRGNLKARMLLVCAAFMAALVALRPDLAGAFGLRGVVSSTFVPLTTAQITVNDTYSPDNTGAARGVWGYLMASSDDFGANFTGAVALAVQSAIEAEVARRGYANATILIYPCRVRASSGAPTEDALHYGVAPVTSLISPDGVVALIDGGTAANSPDWIPLSNDKVLGAEAAATYASGTGVVKVSNDATVGTRKFDRQAGVSLDAWIALFKVTVLSPTPTTAVSATPTPSTATTPTPTSGTGTPTPTSGPVPTDIPTPDPVTPTDPGIPGLTVVPPGSVTQSVSSLALHLTISQLANLQAYGGRYYAKSSVVSSALGASGIRMGSDRRALPVFQASVSGSAPQVFAFSGAHVPSGATRPSQIVLAKILDAETARSFVLATSAAELTATEGRFAVAYGGVILGAGEVLDSSRTYTILLSIRDNGLFDADSASGSILDPCVAGPSQSGGGGGGGCSAAFFPSAILLGVPVIFLLRKRG